MSDEAWRKMLCEQPTWGGLKCIYIGFVPATGVDMCTRYKEPISQDEEGWMTRCESCKAKDGYVERRKL